MSNANDIGSATRLQGTVGQDWYATHVAVRLQDFFFATTPWQRRLWDAGSIFALKELLDASRWHDASVLSSSTVGWLARELERTVGVDHGIGGREIKRALVDELKTNVPYGGRNWRRLEQILPLVEEGYVERWRDAVDGDLRPGAERVARAVAAHLLDRGYSLPYLYGWIRNVGGGTLRDVLDDAARLAAEPDKDYEVVLPFRALPVGAADPTPGNWRNGREVRQWLAQHGGTEATTEPIRHVGGFLYRMKAKDPHAAARITAGIRDRLLARASYAPGSSRTKAFETAWITEVDVAPGIGVRAYDLRPDHRGAYVRSLATEHKLHDVGVEVTVLDDALQLAASLNNSSSPGPALASGWSALESLLFSPSDPQDSKDGRGVVACDRAASLVTCSWPRAELTPLAFGHRSEASDPGTALVGERALALDNAVGHAPTAGEVKHRYSLLRGAPNNRDRCRVVLGAFAESQRLSLPRLTDVATQERMLALIANPHSELADVRRHIQHAFRRMYRMRNIVVHGGAASSVGLEVSVRTAVPLTGAALDRVAHAALVEGVSPLALAARAEISLALVGQEGGQSLSDLLEHRRSG